jgi:hypothetical protein
MMYQQGYDPYSSSQSAPTTSTHTASSSSYAATANSIPSSSNNNNRMHDSVTTTRYTTDPVVMSRQTSDVSIMMARQGSDYVGVAGGGMMNTPENSAQLQPHRIPLPNTASSQPQHQPQVVQSAPPPPPPPQPLHSPTQTTALHPLEESIRQHQQHQSYAPYSPQQQHAPTSTSYYQQPPHSSSPQHHLQQQNNLQQTQLQQEQHPPTSQGMPSIPQSVSPTKQQQQHPHPVPMSPEEEVDFFLRGGSSTSTTTNVETSTNQLHPTNLPPTQSLLAKCHSLALRRAWGDVVQLTKDVLMGSGGGGGGRSKAFGGGGMGGHHLLYTELLRATASSSLSSRETSSKGQPANDGVPELEEEEDRDTLRKETCELIAVRCIALLKLRRYEELRKEVISLGLMPYLPDRRQNSTATASNSNDTSSLAWKEGSLHSTGSKDVLPDWVPFGLRLLAAQQLRLTSTTTEESSLAVDVLYDLRDRTVRTEYWNSPIVLEKWKGAIDNALFNSFVRSKDWRLALHTCQEMILGLECGVRREVELWCIKTSATITTAGTTSGSVSDQERKQMEEVITTAAHVELHSRQLLILLQAGAISAAEMIQKDVRNYATKIESQLHKFIHPSASTRMTAVSRMAKEVALVRQVPIRVLVNEGLLQFSRLNYTEAAKIFLDALNQQQQQLFTTHPSYPTWNELTCPTLGFDAEPSLTEECLTNLSLCMLYSGSMHTAVDKLEGLIRDDPCLYLTEAVAFNLCTLYELGSDGEECTRKKKVLQRVAHRFFLHDIGAEMLRLG